MPNPGFYRASYGNVRLWCSRLSTKAGRGLVVHEMSAGDDHVVQDKGENVVVTRASLLFDYMIGDTLSPLDRLAALRAEMDGRTRVLTHPTRGSFAALIGDFDEEIDASGVVSAEVEFTAAHAVTSAIPAGAMSIPASGEGLVDAAADALDSELVDMELVNPGITTAAKLSADSWTASEDLNPREVMNDTGVYTDALGQQAELYQGDLEQWEVMKRTLLLADAVRSAAEAVTSDSASSFMFRVAAPTALRALLAAEFGAEAADYYYQQAMRFNDIATPGLIPSGTVLQLRSPRARYRNG